MTIWDVRDSKLSAEERLEIYKKNNVFDYLRKTDSGLEVRLGFDETQYVGKGKTLDIALKDVESQWRKSNGDNTFARWWS